MSPSKYWPRINADSRGYEIQDYELFKLASGWVVLFYSVRVNPSLSAVDYSQQKSRQFKPAARNLGNYLESLSANKLGWPLLDKGCDAFSKVFCEPGLNLRLSFEFQLSTIVIRRAGF